MSIGRSTLRQIDLETEANTSAIQAASQLDHLIARREEQETFGVLRTVETALRTARNEGSLAHHTQWEVDHWWNS